MHEVSIALDMVEELIRIAEENDAKKVTSVSLRIGKISGIVTDSLKFAFDAVRLKYPLLCSAEILIEEIPLIYKCLDCKKEIESEEIYFPACAGCKSYNLKIISGEEQHIQNLEIEV